MKVVEWILGPAEKLLASQTEIGDSFPAADELRKQHEQLELKCTVTIHFVIIVLYFLPFLERACIFKDFFACTGHNNLLCKICSKFV